MSGNAAIPPLSLFFGYAAMVPLALAAVAVWIVPTQWAWPIAHGGLIWAGGILAFLAGVRRGLSFRTQGGPSNAQLLTMLWLVGLAILGLPSPWPLVSIVILLIGYCSIVWLDPIAASHHEVPSFFARLRPPQMLLPIGSLLLLTAFAILRG
jgi:hypothetical protein